MKALVQAVALSVAIAASVMAFAQGSVRRQQVRDELVRLEKVGCRLGDGGATDYPVEIQAAQARLAAEQSASTGYGGVSGGMSDTGSGKTVAP